MLNYIDKKRKDTGEHITITHVVGKAMGRILTEATGLNGRIIMDRFVPFKVININGQHKINLHSTRHQM